MKEKLNELLDLSGEIYVTILMRKHYSPRTKELFLENEALAERLKFYKENGYTESDNEDFDLIRSELERIEEQYWEDSNNGDKH